MGTSHAAQLIAAVNMLDYLGDSMPAYLDHEGFHGEPGSQLADPVALYLVDRLPFAVAARCNVFMLEVIDERGNVTDMYTPGAVGDFMERFDAGEYPHLIVGTASIEHNDKAA